jgi:hypothetical protein
MRRMRSGRPGGPYQPDGCIYGSVTCASRQRPVRPYPTGRISWGDPFPGTSCQATIVKSLRDAAATLQMSKLQVEMLAAPLPESGTPLAAKEELTRPACNRNEVGFLLAQRCPLTRKTYTRDAYVTLPPSPHFPRPREKCAQRVPNPSAAESGARAAAAGPARRNTRLYRPAVLASSCSSRPFNRKGSALTCG